MREIKFNVRYQKENYYWENKKDRLTILKLLENPQNWIGVQFFQFTGLKDKNGKEIYEGDIFNCIYKRDGCKHKLIVVWSKSNAGFKLESVGECDQPNVRQTFSDMQRGEIIGNKIDDIELAKEF